MAYLAEVSAAAYVVGEMRRTMVLFLVLSCPFPIAYASIMMQVAGKPLAGVWRRDVITTTELCIRK